MFDLDEVNQMSEEVFVENFGQVVENSPWIARQAWRKAPFSEFSHLQQSIVDVIMSAGPSTWEKILSRHTLFARIEAGEKFSVTAIIRESHRIGLDNLNAEESAIITEFNTKYRTKFGFPFVVCLSNLPDHQSIFDMMKKRLARSRGEELLTGMREVMDIAKIRLAKLVRNEFAAHKKSA